MKLNYLVFTVVVILVILNIILLSDLIKSRINGSNDFANIDFVYKVNQESFLSIRDLPKDKSGDYYVHRNFIRAKSTPTSRDAVLASHCTGNHLYDLISLTEIWQGPISIAVFVPGNQLKDTLSILYLLYSCYTRIYQEVSVHLVHPISAILKENDLQFLIKKSQEIKAECSRVLDVIMNISNNAGKNYGRKIEYPNNLLRNVAKHGVICQYSLVIDIDLKPSQNLYRDFVNFAWKNNLFDGGNSFYNEKSLFVLPTFEINLKNVNEIPKEKSQLIHLLDSGAVQPFYYSQCRNCHKATNYEKWRGLYTTGDGIDVGYESLWSYHWEPFFVSPQTTPDYDERFKQFGFNRISHNCELHVAGYRYFVLDRGFLVHEGFKEKESFHRTKSEELRRNRLLYTNFRNELRIKYPDSAKRCEKPVKEE